LLKVYTEYRIKIEGRRKTSNEGGELDPVEGQREEKGKNSSTAINTVFWPRRRASLALQRKSKSPRTGSVRPPKKD